MNSQGKNNKWLKALKSPHTKLTPNQKKMLMRLGTARNVEDIYGSDSLCIKVNGIYKQVGSIGMQ